MHGGIEGLHFARGVHSKMKKCDCIKYLELVEIKEIIVSPEEFLDIAAKQERVIRRLS